MICIEKMLLKIPKLYGSIERFYGTIVKESLFGKDTDVAEDVSDYKCDVDIITWRRRRNEICIGLKRSNIIYNSYILKNIVVEVVITIFIITNVYFSFIKDEESSPALCEINILPVPELGLKAGKAFFTCEGKDIKFFHDLQYVQVLSSTRIDFDGQCWPACKTCYKMVAYI